MEAVVLKNIVKNYGSLEVVHGINASIKPGEFVVLVGPSGCGKSTVLRMIAGLEEITSGDLHIGERMVNGLAPKDRNIAMVFQSYALYPHMTVFDNIAFSLKLKKRPKPEIKKSVNDVANILGLEQLLNRKPGALSGGQRQRVAMGRAIVRKPSVFLFDEPLSNLDAKLRIQMRLEIKKLHNRVKSTIIYVTHDQVEAMTLADRIVIMRNGHIEQMGSPLELFNYPSNTFVAGFLGSPPMNMMGGTVHIQGDRASIKIDDTLSIDISEKSGDFNIKDNQSVVFGIRPENIFLESQSDQIKNNAIVQLKSVVDISEPLGNETVVHFKINSTAIVGSIKSTQKIKAGDPADIILDYDAMHLFDGSSGKTLRS